MDSANKKIFRNILKACKILSKNEYAVYVDRGDIMQQVKYQLLNRNPVSDVEKRIYDTLTVLCDTGLLIYNGKGGYALKSPNIGIPVTTELETGRRTMITKGGDHKLEAGVEKTSVLAEPEKKRSRVNDLKKKRPPQHTYNLRPLPGRIIPTGIPNEVCTYTAPLPPVVSVPVDSQNLETTKSEFIPCGSTPTPKRKNRFKAESINEAALPSKGEDTPNPE